MTYRFRISTKFGKDPRNATVIFRFPTDVEVINYPVPVIVRLGDGPRLSNLASIREQDFSGLGEDSMN